MKSAFDRQSVIPLWFKILLLAWLLFLAWYCFWPKTDRSATLAPEWKESVR